ncbi:MAG: SxtJ family membrane protein [Xanthobacteraceae bacterium]
MFAAVFLIGLFPLLRLDTPRWWALAIAAGFLALALVLPNVLAPPLNTVWMAFGRLLHKIVSPLVMGAVFFLAVTPVALIMRARKKDLLSEAAAGLDGYWIVREAPDDPAQMKKQF